MGKGKKGGAKKMSSGMSKTYRANRQAKLPEIHAGKKRRLIARLKTFGVNGDSNESIQTLRDRLHPFVRRPKLKRTDFKSQLLEINV
jgi:hypothetical protein